MLNINILPLRTK